MLKRLGPYHASIVHEQLIASYVWCSKRLRYEVHQHIPTINNDATGVYATDSFLFTWYLK